MEESNNTPLVSSVLSVDDRQIVNAIYAGRTLALALNHEYLQYFDDILKDKELMRELRLREAIFDDNEATICYLSRRWVDEYEYKPKLESKVIELRTKLSTMVAEALKENKLDMSALLGG